MTSATLYCTPTRLSQPRNEEVNTNKSNNNKASVVEARQVQSYRRIVSKNYSLRHWQKTPSPILVRPKHYCCVECCNHSNHQFVRLVCKAVLNKKAQKCLLTPIVNTVRLILFPNSIINISCSLIDCPKHKSKRSMSPLGRGGMRHFHGATTTKKFSPH